MPRDLFEENNITVNNSTKAEPRDLFAEANINPNSTGALGAVDAAAMGVVQGTVSGIETMGQLANNILKTVAPKFVQKGAEKFAEKVWKPQTEYLKNTFSPQTDFEKQAVQEHPNFYQGGNIVGNYGTQIATMAPASAPVTAGIRAGLVKTAPMLGKSPIIEGMINQGIQGAGLGAANEPDNLFKGAVTGGTLGAALGGIGGMIGQKLQRSGDVLEFEKQNAVQAGIDPNSYEGITRAKNALKNNGADYAKYKVGQKVSSGVKEQIEPLAPSLIDGEMPAETLTKMSAQNFQQVRSEIQKGFEPISKITTTFNPQNFNKIKEGLSSNTLKKLPDTVLPDQATPQEIWDYRQALDDNIRVLSRKAKESILAAKQVKTLTNAREALTTDLLNATEKSGLKNQFLQAEAIYKTKQLPYAAFKTDIRGNELSEKAINDIMTKFNKFTTAKSNLNINDIKNIASTLGPEGNKTMGWALLQKSMLDATDAKGITNAKTLFSRVRKYKNMGVFNILKDEDLTKAVNGIIRIADGADEMVKQGTPIDAISFLSKQIPNLLGTTAGRSLLTLLGTSGYSRTKLRAVIGNLIAGSLVIHKTEQEAASQTSQ